MEAHSLVLFQGLLAPKRSLALHFRHNDHDSIRSDKIVVQNSKKK